LLGTLELDLTLFEAICSYACIEMIKAIFVSEPTSHISLPYTFSFASPFEPIHIPFLVYFSSIQAK